MLVLDGPPQLFELRLVLPAAGVRALSSRTSDVVITLGSAQRPQLVRSSGLYIRGNAFVERTRLWQRHGRGACSGCQHSRTTPQGRSRSCSPTAAGCGRRRPAVPRRTRRRCTGGTRTRCCRAWLPVRPDSATHSRHIAQCQRRHWNRRVSSNSFSRLESAAHGSLSCSAVQYIL